MYTYFQHAPGEVWKWGISAEAKPKIAAGGSQPATTSGTQTAGDKTQGGGD